MNLFIYICCFISLSLTHPTPDNFEHPEMLIHSTGNRMKRELPALSFKPSEIEKDPDFWNNKAGKFLEKQLNKNRLNKKMAKNVIFFLGDGMGISTLMASRMYKGGEELELSFEQFPYSGLSKTYCVNTQVADSACSATSYLSGVKGNYGTIGLSAAVIQGDCIGQNNTSHHVESLIRKGQRSGMRTGIITNTRITHATPAGTYANIANRNWENDVRVKNDGGNTETCPDIAYQLIHGHVGKKLNVILGGGRQEFITENEKDIDGNFGRRSDKNLINVWMHIHRHKNSKYVETKEQLMKVNDNVERLLGLFDSNHMPFHLDDEAETKPSLSEMVNKALNIFESSDDDKGYILFIEGGKIDHGHHFGLAKKALDETIEFEKAVELARTRTSEDDTLIVVTADHSHSFTVSGYASRGNNILGLNDGMKSSDGFPYTTLGYENGPSFYQNIDKEGRRINLENENVLSNDYGYPTQYPLPLETHGGEDVGVFASGPHAHLFTGVYEQNFIPHAIKYIACIGDGLTFCSEDQES
ncbi:CLUMA_CG005526, isoform A [Clunio marinus]|uniref:Alkaline phosphatase n=1 Tax=Clunio marinus TaxID=568069 RepID=A0A1J1HWJ2_9DIPT|nr:CLUMA_CG005526, isoform A [Clunio marinus]